MARARLVMLALLCVPSVQPAAQHSPQVRKNDNSDWWSQIRANNFERQVAVQKREPAASNLKILEIDLGNDMFTKAEAKLGRAQSVERGDASAGRAQICYTSVEEHPSRIHLVFETGEVSDWFYLFADGPDWNGSDLCLKSNLVAGGLSVSSGLRLGQTLAEVEAILGKPSLITDKKVVYSFAVEKKTPSAEFKKLRQQHPELSEEELRQNYGSYFLGVYIEARFAQLKLNYLAVSKTESD